MVHLCTCRSSQPHLCFPSMKHLWKLQAISGSMRLTGHLWPIYDPSVKLVWSSMSFYKLQGASRGVPWSQEAARPIQDQCKTEGIGLIGVYWPLEVISSSLAIHNNNHCINLKVTSWFTRADLPESNLKRMLLAAVNNNLQRLLKNIYRRTTKHQGL